MDRSTDIDNPGRGEEIESLQARFVFFAILLFAALLGIFAAIAFSFHDIPSATVLAIVGLMTFVGLTTQMIAGLSRYVRLYYGLCGALVFLFVVARGGQDGSGLYGALGMTLGFVVILGWRQALVFLSVLIAAVALVFVEDAYLSFATPLPVIVELKFFVALLGIALLALGYGYLTEIRVANLRHFGEKMAALAFEDAMTELPNRRSTENMLEQRWEEHKRSGNPFAVCLCNIDNFKEINSKFGRGFGDGVILRIANVLTNGLRAQDIIARWGEDDFFVILPGQSCQFALLVAERIRSRVENIDLVMHGEPVKVAVSIGVASTENALGATDLIALAEAGLYQAKNMGKNRVVVG